MQHAVCRIHHIIIMLEYHRGERFKKWVGYMCMCMCTCECKCMFIHMYAYKIQQENGQNLPCSVVKHWVSSHSLLLFAFGKLETLIHMPRSLLHIKSQFSSKIGRGVISDDRLNKRSISWFHVSGVERSRVERWVEELSTNVCKNESRDQWWQ